MTDVPKLLEAANRGDTHAAAELLPLVCDELRKLAAARMASEKPGQTLNATALVHEAWLNPPAEFAPGRCEDGIAEHSTTDLVDAIRSVLQESAEPMTLPRICERLPEPYQNVCPQNLADVLRRQVAARLVTRPRSTSS